LSWAAIVNGFLRYAGTARSRCVLSSGKRTAYCGRCAGGPNQIAAGQVPIKDYFHALKKLQEMKIPASFFPRKPFSRVGIRVGLIAEYRKRQLLC
jgi:hypothetical protein